VAGHDTPQPGRDDALGTVLTRQQVAEWLKVRPRQVDRLAIPRLDLGHKTKRYLAKDVQAWLETQRSLPAAAVNDMLTVP
jgi:hypothetical protein